MGDSDEMDDCTRSEELLELFARGTELTRQLLDETACLRRRLADLPNPDGTDVERTAGEQVALCDWIAKIDELQCENRSLLDDLRAAEDRNRGWAARHAEIEERHNDLANLYVASYQLHASFDPKEVVAAISEIVINLIGAEVFALYACDTESGRLTPVASEGRPLASFPVSTVGTGIIGTAVAEGALFVASPIAPEREVRNEGEPVVVIPLYVRGSALGAIALYKLFDQKSGLSELDRQLFGLLASHAATAILASRLFPMSVPFPGKSPSQVDRITN
jgi:hypothetical protein